MLITQLIVIQIITFIALVFVLRKIMYSASFKETKRLQQLSQENARRTQELAKKIEEAETEYKRRIYGAEEEMRRLKAQAQQEIEQLRQESLSKAKQESERIVNQALNAKEKIKEEIEAQMRGKSIALASKLTARILASKNQRLLHEGLIDEILEEIEKIEPSKLQVKVDKGELITPYEIAKAKKDKIASLLSRKTGKEISLEEKIAAEMIAGITIKLGSLVIDGSLAGKLKEAAEIVKKE